MWSLDVIGLSAVLISIPHVLYFDSVVACVLRDPVILGSALYEGHPLLVSFGCVLYLVVALYIKRGKSLF